MSLSECQAKCLKGCNCTAYYNLDIRNGGSGCLLWFCCLNDIQGYSEDGQDLYVRVATSEIALAVILGLYLLHKFKKRRLHRAEIVQLNSRSDTSNRNERQDLDIPLLDFEQIAKATDDFSFRNKLGEGVFGTVYKIMVCHCKATLGGRVAFGNGCLNQMLNIECVKRTCPCGELCSNSQVLDMHAYEARQKEYAL